MTQGKPPHNVVPFERGKAKKPARPQEGDLFALLSRIDELEEALETLDEAGITTRDELEELIGRLEAEAAALDDPDKT
jgi:hypothetical protein